MKCRRARLIALPQMWAHAHTTREKIITNPLRTAVIPQSTQNYSFQAFSLVRHFQECHTETQKNRSGLKPVIQTAGQCHHEPRRSTVGSSATCSAAKPRQTTGIAQYPPPSPDRQENPTMGSPKPPKCSLLTVICHLSQLLLNFITTLLDLYSKNHFSLLHKQELTSMKKEVLIFHFPSLFC